MDVASRRKTTGTRQSYLFALNTRRFSAFARRYPLWVKNGGSERKLF